MAEKNKKVVVFSTPDCPYCKMTKNFLDENHINFEEKNVAEDQNAAREMIEKSGQMGVPVILIDNEFVVGYDTQKLNSLLEVK